MMSTSNGVAESFWQQSLPTSPGASLLIGAIIGCHMFLFAALATLPDKLYRELFFFVQPLIAIGWLVMAAVDFHDRGMHYTVFADVALALWNFALWNRDDDTKRRRRKLRQRLGRRLALMKSGRPKVVPQ